MPPVTRPHRRPTTETAAPSGGVVAWFKQWLALREEEKLLGTRIKELHGRLCDTVQREGYPDEKGSLFLDLDEPIGGFAQLKYQRQVTKSLNEERAEELLEEKGIKDQCTALVMLVTDQTAAIDMLEEAGLLVPGQTIDAALDQEEIMKAHYEGLITQEELDSIFDVSESYSFRQVKE